MRGTIGLFDSQSPSKATGPSPLTLSCLSPSPIVLGVSSSAPVPICSRRPSLPQCLLRRKTLGAPGRKGPWKGGRQSGVRGFCHNPLCNSWPYTIFPSTPPPPHTHPMWLWGEQTCGGRCHPQRFHGSMLFKSRGQDIVVNTRSKTGRLGPDEVILLGAVSGTGSCFPASSQDQCSAGSSTS